MTIVVTFGTFINNMKADRRNTIVLITFLAFLIGILVFWKFFIQKPSKKEVPLPSPTPTPFIISPTPELSAKQKIINLLPIVTVNYTIEYLPKPDKIFVLILSEPFEKYKEEVEEWLYTQGIENLDELDITWGATRRGIAPGFQP